MSATSKAVHHRLSIAVAFLLTAGFLVGSTLAPPAMGVALKKNYTASIASASPAPENNKDSLFGGQSVDLAVTITNGPSSQQTLGSVNITIPSQYTPIAVTGGVGGLVSVATSPVAKDWSPSSLDTAAGLIKLRNPGPSNTNALNPGQSVTAVVRIITECSPNSTETWVTHVKQSNDFSGVGNDFTRIGSDPTTTVHVGCATHLAFSQQPTNTLAGQIINASLPSPGVKVQVLDSADQLVTISSASVSIAIDSNPGPGILYGTSPVNAVQGEATFLDLIIDTAGNGYTLAASSSPLTGKTSSSFDISGVAGKCVSVTQCGTATGIGHATASDKTVASVNVPVGPCNTGVCFVSLEETTGAFCNGPCTGDSVVFASPPNQSSVGTLKIEIYKTLVTQPLSAIGVFKLNDDGSVTQLFDCSTTNPAPCVADRSMVAGGNAVFTIFVVPGPDPTFGHK